MCDDAVSYSTVVFIKNTTCSVWILTSHLQHRKLFWSISLLQVKNFFNRYVHPNLLVLYHLLAAFTFPETIVHERFYETKTKCCWLKITRTRSVERGIRVCLKTDSVREEKYVLHHHKDKLFEVLVLPVRTIVNTVNIVVNRYRWNNFFNHCVHPNLLVLYRQLAAFTFPETIVRERFYETKTKYRKLKITRIRSVRRGIFTCLKTYSLREKKYVLSYFWDKLFGVLVLPVRTIVSTVNTLVNRNRLNNSLDFK